MSQSTDTPLIQVTNLSIDFWSHHHWTNVVRSVSFEVHAGEAMGLVGESGCGKTTTAYTLLGYRRPNSRIREGQVFYRGQDLLRLSGKALQGIRGRHISLVSQNPTTALSPGLTIEAQIIEVLRAHNLGTSANEQSARTLELLQQVQLPDPERTAKKYPHQLSGGQQQRAVIAMALACKPDFLVLDEPTTGLDVTTQSQILDLLAQLRAEQHMAMVYVTHDLGVISLICDRVGVMYAGELVETAPTRELFTHPRHPYTRGLITSIPSVRKPRREKANLLRGYLQRDQFPDGCRFAPRCDFAQERCFMEPQSLELVSGNHMAACWRWGDIKLPTVADASVNDEQLTSLVGGSLLNVENISCAYDIDRSILFARRKPQTVVQDVSFDIHPSETFALVGESGSGKSTIARTIAGLMQPSAGIITFEGHNIIPLVKARTQEQRREIQLIFQNPDASLNPRQPVGQIIGQPLRIFFDLTGTAQRERVEQLLQDVRLDGSYRNRYPDELSGGERQRVAIARALAAQPKLLLCDEILSALDVSVQANVLELLRGLQAKHHFAYLFISHDLAVVRTLAHRVGVLYKGQLCETGQVEEVFAAPYHPYTHMLFSAVPSLDSQTKSTSVVRGDIHDSHKHTACPFAERCPWKVGDICDEVEPPWQPTSPTHGLRCHIPLSELQTREVWTEHPS
ncbi:MAG: ABC transporter ATP-binding protein [Anaerolineae bacterium]